VWLTDRGIIDIDERSPIAWVYAPLEVAADKCPPLERAITLYLVLWEAPLAPQPPPPARTYSGPASALPAPTPAVAPTRGAKY
jgi:hypothetical protein